MVSTHSHPKVAASGSPNTDILFSVSTHSRPKVAALPQDIMGLKDDEVSTHSHPKVAA